MTEAFVLPKDKKLIVQFRLEPGCLGPDGADFVEDFCLQANKVMKVVDAEFVIWQIIPRFDKSLPEIEYFIADKVLSRDKADKYLELFDKELDEFELHLDEKLTALVDAYLAK